MVGQEQENRRLKQTNQDLIGKLQAMSAELD